MKAIILTTVTASVAYASVISRGLTAKTIPGWVTSGCYTDSQSRRTLQNQVAIGSDISGTVCQQKCQDLGYNRAGCVYGGQCYCDNYVYDRAQSRNESECDMACPADATQQCGGADRITLFYNQSPPPPPADSKEPVPNGWSYKACWTDSVANRTMPYWINAPDTGMTYKYCLEGCQDAGYTIGGMEYGNECFCANSLAPGSKEVFGNQCNMRCKGDSGQFCGDANRLSLYQLSDAAAKLPRHQKTGFTQGGWSWGACAPDYPRNVTNSIDMKVWQRYYGSPVVPNTCIEICSKQNAGWASIQGDNCICSIYPQAGFTLQQYPRERCNLPCTGDSTLACGGQTTYEVYVHN